MSAFWAYLTIGWYHIISLEGLDHLLFILVLSCRFGWHQWRPLVWMITAFTVGHTLSLVAGVLGIWSVDSYLVELIIPATILVSAEINVVWPYTSLRTTRALYGITMVFGLVHGMGFSTSLQSLLGNSGAWVVPLAGFNLGIELAQVVTLAMVLAVNTALLKLSPNHVTPQRLAIIESALAAALALWFFVERI